MQSLLISFSWRKAAVPSGLSRHFAAPRGQSRRSFRTSVRRHGCPDAYLRYWRARRQSRAPTHRTEHAFALFYTGTIGSGAVAPVIYGILGDATGTVCATIATALTALLPL